jgi:hypothetical protein
MRLESGVEDRVEFALATAQRTLSWYQVGRCCIQVASEEGERAEC